MSVERLREDGYVVLEGVLDADERDGVRRDLEPFFGEGHWGRNDFEGERTQRIYGLPRVSPALAALSAHPRVLPLAEAILGPSLLLSAAHAIGLHSGETAQRLHFDDSFYPGSRPREALGVSTIWAIDPFRDENGATRIVPGSHRIGDVDVKDRDARALEMEPGSVVVFLGTLYHGGGANSSDATRLGLTYQYCMGWARAQENWFLTLTREQVRGFPKRVRQLLGYELHPPFMGHVAGRHPEKSL
jgi:ectoine hydroxylase-related dioxygenase (phytanoyl-CoA dioxygenase family)